MASVKQRDTQPELVVRRTLHRVGYRHRLHVPALPGKPDLVLPRHHKIIFVHGRFWHRHNCRRATTPATRRGFWEEKFAGNKRRDRRNRADLQKAGWKVLVIWECQTGRPESLEQRLKDFMEGK